MKKQIVSWGLIFSLLVTLLPMSAVAADGDLPEGEHPAADAAQCTCGAQPDAEGVIIHENGCPQAVEPDQDTEGPDQGTEEPDQDTEEPDQDTEEPDQDTEEPDQGTEEPDQGTEEPAPVELTPPVLFCTPLDGWSSDMVLYVDGEWDSYTWEACAYGFWFTWEGDGPELILSKEDFVSYGFRCTVTRGEQAVTSEVFAYEPSVMDRPMLMANGLSDGSLSGESEYIRYYKHDSSNRFDIQGVDDGTAFRTTYANRGYCTAISVNEGSKVDVPYQETPVSVGSSLTADTKLDIVYGGRYVRITYTVKNNGSTAQDFKIGSSADVMIDNNDRAAVTGTDTGLSMDGAPKNSYQFSLVAPDCDTLWFGHFSQASSNIFNDLPDKTAVYDGDSGMAWSWEGTVAPGYTWTRYVLIGAGELPDPPDAPVIDLDPGTQWQNGQTINVPGMAAGSNPADIVHISIGGQEFETAVNPDGTFSVPVSIPLDMPGGQAVLTYWGTTDEGGISAIQSITVNIADVPGIELTAHSVSVMEDDQLPANWLSSFVKAYSGTLDISPDSISTDTPKTYEITYTASKAGFESATEILTVTVLPKPAELTETTVSGTDTFSLSATMLFTGGLEYQETGFVYGALQNPTLKLMDGKVTTDPVVNAKNGSLTAAIPGDELAYGVNYFARAYAVATDGTVVYGDQSLSFGIGAPDYGVFSVKNNNDNTFTITRTGTDGAQTVYYRTVNGSAIGGTHFAHVAGSVYFGENETSKTIEVQEYVVTNTYRDNAATAYSNADRTYCLEIYRVTGGAGIDKNNASATRTMAKDPSKTMTKALYTSEKQTDERVSSTVTIADNTKDDGASDTNVNFYGNRYGTNNWHDELTLQDFLPADSFLDYYNSTVTGWLFRFELDGKETEDGYEHFWIGSSAPPTGFISTDGGGAAVSDQYTGHKWTGTYQFSATMKDLKVPLNGTNGGVGSGEAYKTKGTLTQVNGNYYAAFAKNETAHLYFGSCGKDEDVWEIQSLTGYALVTDAREPQLLGVAPMAGGSYLPGESVTVALVFDEIVDSENSTLENVSVVTNWGTFPYAGGADTNVLYFTGTVSDTAIGSLTVTSITGNQYIRDMAADEGVLTDSSVDVDTSAALGSTNAPTVTVGNIVNTNGTLTAAVACSPVGAKLEYVWSTSQTAPAAGWQTVASGTSVSTRQTSGTWYLHARAINGDGVTVYGSQSIELGAEGTVQLPGLTVTANNDTWATSRTIAIDKSPSTATLTVKTPDGTASIPVEGNSYVATENGVYTFTLQSGGESVIKTVTVSKIDRTAPTVEIANLTNTTHTEAVILTVRVSDGESGIASVKGKWNNEAEFELTPTGQAVFIL